ncbi:hypothetical protein [Rhodohalobacter mucosus]|uniref:hypothetical protein n=1 Tax=Rhodohalobacter mucosus TaxID=2079485 RepID=UPI0011B1D6CB|nr:hypothetical protein [Rhodohalobacter mucosus]
MTQEERNKVFEALLWYCEQDTLAIVMIFQYWESLMNKEMNTDIRRLLNYCAENGRVCPMPHKWKQLYELLPNTKRKLNGGFDPPAPLILSAWHHSSNFQKIMRLKEHIEWAVEQGSLETIAQYLYSLDEEDWFYQNH